MKNERTWHLMGMILGAAVVLIGIIFLATPMDTGTPTYPDTASFGADFYTYQYKVTRIAASNVYVAANNIRALGEKLTSYAGFAFIVAGLLIFLHYGKRYFCAGEAPAMSDVLPELPDLPVAPAAAVSPAQEELRQYEELLRQGILTQEEFNAKKQQLQQ